MEPQLLRAVRPRDLVDPRHHRAGFRHDPPAATSLDGAEAREIEHDPAGKRHGLSVIAGAGAARRDGDAELIGGGERRHDLGLGDGGYEDIPRNASSWLFRRGEYQ